MHFSSASNEYLKPDGFTRNEKLRNNRSGNDMQENLTMKITSFNYKNKYLKFTVIYDIYESRELSFPIGAYRIV